MSRSSTGCGQSREPSGRTRPSAHHRRSDAWRKPDDTLDFLLRYARLKGMDASTDGKVQSHGPVLNEDRRISGL
jgi:hypothetical protein